MKLFFHSQNGVIGLVLEISFPIFHRGRQEWFSLYIPVVTLSDNLGHSLLPRPTFLKEKGMYIFVGILFIIHNNFGDLKIVEYYLQQILLSIINQDK